MPALEMHRSCSSSPTARPHMASRVRRPQTRPSLRNAKPGAAGVLLEGPGRPYARDVRCGGHVERGHLTSCLPLLPSFYRLDPALRTENNNNRVCSPQDCTPGVSTSRTPDSFLGMKDTLRHLFRPHQQHLQVPDFRVFIASRANMMLVPSYSLHPRST